MDLQHSAIFSPNTNKIFCLAPRCPKKGEWFVKETRKAPAGHAAQRQANPEATLSFADRHVPVNLAIMSKIRQAVFPLVARRSLSAKGQSEGPD